MKRPTLIWLAIFGTSFLLLGAFWFQYILGLQACELCLWQRWPHVTAILIGILALIMPAWAFSGIFISYLGAIAMTTSAAIAFYHTGVERHWWLSRCSGSIATEGLSAENLLAQIFDAPVVLCDAVAWQMVGLSMASWNGIASVLLAVLWLNSKKK